MPGLSDTLEQSLIEAIFKKTAFPSITNLWISLHSADPEGAGANELSGGGYARVNLDPDTNNATNTNWNASSTTSGTAHRMSNKLDITFPTATGNWNSGLAIPYWGCWSAVSGGTFYLSGTISVAGVVVLNGNTLRIVGGTPGSLSFDVD